MTHEIFYLQQQSYETLTIILVGGGVSSAIVLAFASGLRAQYIAAPARRRVTSGVSPGTATARL